ncbi:MAG: transcription termination/antitermination factor NusG [Deltaproteobacteria bacterium]|nr:transcription termination/antitermination factor NusG [Deltaproteobacteria bacterium]
MDSVEETKTDHLTEQASEQSSEACSAAESFSAEGVSAHPAQETTVDVASPEGAAVDEFAGLTDEERTIVTDPRYRWYIVNTYSGSEETARLALKERIVRGGLEEQFGEIFVPKMVVEKVLKSGKKKLMDRTTFPGYIMVQMNMNDQTMGCVTSTPKVTGFVGNRRNPRPMGDREVLRLLNPAVAAANKAEDASRQIFKKGEGIRVTDGPFTNFDGIIDEVRADKMKLKVLVSIFGRETPVELSYNQVEKQS